MVYIQVKLKLAWSAIITSEIDKILHEAIIGFMLSEEQIIKGSIRLCGCTGWSAPVCLHPKKSDFFA